MTDPGRMIRVRRPDGTETRVSPKLYDRVYQAQGYVRLDVRANVPDNATTPKPAPEVQTDAPGNAEDAPKPRSTRRRTRRKADD